MSLTCTAVMRSLEGADPVERVGAALDHPGDVGLPFEVRAALEDRHLRDGAVRGRLELEVVVVPAEAEAGVAVGLARLLQPRAELGPAAGAVGALVGRQDTGSRSSRCRAPGRSRAPGRARCSSMSRPKCPVGMTSPLSSRLAFSSATLAGVGVERAVALDARVAELGRASSACRRAAGSCASCRAGRKSRSCPVSVGRGRESSTQRSRVVEADGGGVAVRRGEDDLGRLAGEERDRVVGEPPRPVGLERDEQRQRLGARSRATSGRRRGPRSPAASLGSRRSRRLVAAGSAWSPPGGAVRGAPAQQQDLALAERRRRAARSAAAAASVPTRASAAPSRAGRPVHRRRRRARPSTSTGSAVSLTAGDAEAVRPRGSPTTVHRREEAPRHVVQELPAAAVVEARPARHRPGVVELPVERAHAVRLQAAPVVDRGLDRDALLHLARARRSSRNPSGKRK